MMWVCVTDIPDSVTICSAGALSFDVSSQNSQSPEQKVLLHNDTSLGSRFVSVKTKEIGPQDLGFLLKDIDLSTFPDAVIVFENGTSAMETGLATLAERAGLAVRRLP